MSGKISGFWLLPSYRCNNNCRWCYVGGLLNSGKEASLEDVKRYIKQLADAGAKNCILIGGEPSIYPDILEAIRFASSLGIKVKMMSNGRKLADTSFVRKLREAGLAYCSVSIEGMESVHDTVTRVKGSFRQSIEGIKNCIEEGIPVNTISTVSSYNRSTIHEMVDFLSVLSIRSIVFNMCSAQPSGYKEIKDEGMIEPNEYARIIEDVGLTHEMVRFYALIPLCLFDQEKLRRLLSLKRIKIACSLYSNAVAVDPAGNLLPCTHMAGLNYGNLNDHGMLEGALARKKGEIEFLKTYAPSHKCTDCRLWNTCMGGCNLIWFSRRASDFIKGF